MPNFRFLGENNPKVYHFIVWVFLPNRYCTPKTPFLLRFWKRFFFSFFFLFCFFFFFLEIFFFLAKKKKKKIIIEKYLRTSTYYNTCRKILPKTFVFTLFCVLFPIWQMRDKKLFCFTYFNFDISIYDKMKPYFFHIEHRSTSH